MNTRANKSNRSSILEMLGLADSYTGPKKSLVTGWWQRDRTGRMSDHEEMDNCKTLKVVLAVFVFMALSACTEKDDVHTTAIRHVPPPPRQVLTILSKPLPRPAPLLAPDSSADPTKPLLILNLANGSTFRVGDEVPISFKVLNAKLKREGGEFSIRYIIDDDDMQWRYTQEPFWFAGWLPGKHTIRVELIGPDLWPYKNGNANIVTREISVEP